MMQYGLHGLDVLPRAKAPGILHGRSSERRATPQVCMEAHSGGGRHRPDYQAGACILLPDIDRSDTVPMIHKATLLLATAVHAPCGFVPPSTRRTGDDTSPQSA